MSDDVDDILALCRRTLETVPKGEMADDAIERLWTDTLYPQCDPATLDALAHTGATLEADLAGRPPLADDAWDRFRSRCSPSDLEHFAFAGLAVLLGEEFGLDVFRALRSE